MTSAIMRTAHDLFLQGFCAFAPGGVVLANAFMRGRGTASLALRSRAVAGEIPA
jgi:hypothetical protein